MQDPIVTFICYISKFKWNSNLFINDKMISEDMNESLVEIVSLDCIRIISI